MHLFMLAALAWRNPHGIRNDYESDFFFLVCSKIFALVIFVTGAIKALSGATLKSLPAPVYFFAGAYTEASCLSSKVNQSK